MKQIVEVWKQIILDTWTFTSSILEIIEFRLAAVALYAN